MDFKKGFFGLAALFAWHNAAAEAIDTVRVIVKYKNPPATVKNLQQALGLAAKLPVKRLEPIAGGSYVLIFDSSTLQSAKAQSADPTPLVLQRLKADPNVVYAVKDRVGYFKPLPQIQTADNTRISLLSHDVQWDEFSRPGGVMLESAPGRQDGAWAHTTGESNPPVVIAVLDTGIALHESLQDNLVKKDGVVWGWNFAGNNEDLRDETESYHGTHVAGTIAGYGQVVKGMGEQLKILPVKIPDASGMFYESSVINAIRWSVGDQVPGVPDNPYPAQVLNMSFGVDERPGKEVDHCDEALQEALGFARQQGAIVVAAAGNDNRWEHFNAPAVCNGAIKVASTGPQGLRAYYSNYGPSITFAAPGGDLSSRNPLDGILSTVNPGGGYQNSGYAFYQGTSMAAPHVAGVAGLIFAASPKPLSPQKIEQILYTTTHEFGESSLSDKSCIGEKPCGHGILDAENAIKATLAQFDVLYTAPGSKPASHWLAVEPTQSFVPKTHSAHVQKGADGKIYALSGSKIYQLDGKAFQHCEIIGFDGVGCHK